jgi:outer membrane protein OmpA-like peptidoglycan-associated protein
VPVVEPAAEPAPEELSPAADEAVTPEAVEALPVDIAPEEAAPLLDSAMDVQTEVAAGEPPAEQPPQEPAPVEPVVAPTSDAEAQAAIAPVEIQSVEAEQGQQIAEKAIALAPAPEQIQAAALPENVTIINNVTNNTTIINNNAPTNPVIFQVGINIVINNPEQERDRMYRPDEDRIFYEELRNGRTRETIVRPNGVRIVTVRNRWGDVLQRSRFTPDGREFILAYYDEEDDDRDDRESFFIDPGEDLPPLRLNIPAREYILDVEDADEEEVELFFRQPPVEQVRRIYSVEEVKRSARVRDSVRRIEVGGLTFDSGKATISSSQVGALSKVARAMLAVLDENPAETFLIEGHTDAVGSETSNLVLSDQRAAVVAQILTDFYKVPPENLVTQGYGERYLKVKTEGNEPINRRVTIKRITSLITVAEN